MSPLNHPESNDDGIVIETPIVGFMGPPGNGKSVAINTVEFEGNREQLGQTLGFDRALQVGVARKSTSRAGRGADDRFKKSGLPEEAFDDPNMIGVYRLSNNNSLYGYHTDDLRAAEGTDLLIAEPSLHHIAELKQRIRGNFHVVFFASDRTYRNARLNGRGTEDAVEVKKRILEGDAQMIMASLLGADMARGVEDLTDADMVALFNAVRNAQDDGELARATAELDAYLATYVGGDAAAAKKYSASTAKLYTEDVRHVAPGMTRSIDHVITFDDSYITKDPMREGKFRKEILEQVVGILS